MSYIHPESPIIGAFIQSHIPDTGSVQSVCSALLAWFDTHIAYSRLGAPFLPLQRSDLDVLVMESGTCGDYANLTVSVLLRLGYEAQYAYVRRDCYGDEQDHICAAVREEGAWILVDAAMPYRKWFGFRCPHREYELLSPTIFEERMKKEEAHWTQAAERCGNRRLAGLFYAPWIHEETLRQTEDTWESVFFLLSWSTQTAFVLYAYYLRYSRECGCTPVMGICTGDTQRFCFSCRPAAGIWDNEQWSAEYAPEDIPSEYMTEAFAETKACLARLLPAIRQIIREAEEHSAPI